MLQTITHTKLDRFLYNIISENNTSCGTSCCVVLFLNITDKNVATNTEANEPCLFRRRLVRQKTIERTMVEILRAKCVCVYFFVYFSLSLRISSHVIFVG